jgi:hypothetical protein
VTTSGAIRQQAEPAQQVPPPAKAGMANPAPWAVTAFATTSFMIGMYQTHLLNNAGISIVLSAAFFFGGLVQIIVAIMEFTRGAMHGPDVPFRPTREVDHLAWVPLADTRRLGYQGDAYAIDALGTLADAVRSGPAVLLVHNARAVPAGPWHGARGHRPLDVMGWEQAESLRRTLPAFAPSRLLSPSEARFVDAMRPLSAEVGVAVEIEPAFGEEEYAAYPRHGLTRISSGPRYAVLRRRFRRPCPRESPPRPTAAARSAPSRPETGYWPAHHPPGRGPMLGALLIGHHLDRFLAPPITRAGRTLPTWAHAVPTAGAIDCPGMRPSARRRGHAGRAGARRATGGHPACVGKQPA